MCLALYQASCPKNRSRTAHGWIPMWRKMNCEKTPSSTEQLVPANKALLKKLTRAQDERRCHRACASVPPDSSTDHLPKYMPVREDRFLRDLATPKSSLNSPVFSPPHPAFTAALQTSHRHGPGGTHGVFQAVCQQTEGPIHRRSV